MNPIPDSQVLDRLKESPLWKATEDAALEERSERRRQLLGEGKGLLAARRAEAARLHRAERKARSDVEAARRLSALSAITTSARAPRVLPPAPSTVS